VGVVRFLLAAAVVLGHAPGWAGLNSGRYADGFISPYHAVQAFFVISGFYMSLSYPKYRGSIGRFYVSRYLRLAPPYWIVACAAVVMCIVFPQNDASVLLFHWFGAAEGWWAALVVFSNATLVGVDGVSIMQYFGWPQYLAVPQIWSVGAEIWFYLLVPVLVQARGRILIALIAIGVALRVIFLTQGLSFWPWQQRVFPVELPFFIVGIFSHRFYVWTQSRRIALDSLGRIAILALIVIITTSSKFNSPQPGASYLWTSLFMAVVLAVLTPAAFHVSQKSTIDRHIGDLSYPLYLCHILIGFYYEPAQHLWNGYFLLLISTLGSAILLLIERPIEGWRRRFAEHSAETRALATKAM
jgi:peptidoglycan/LPS O-acetylase OafA/YrhL